MRVKRKNRSIMIITLIILTFFDSTMEKTFANGFSISEQDKFFSSRQYEKSRDSYRYTKDKIDLEISKTTQCLDTSIEEFLNLNGVFDDEIIQSDEEILRDLIGADVEELQVYTSFYKIENSGQNTSDKIEEITSEEINDVIADVYYDTIVHTKKNENSIVDIVLELVGIKPIEVQAEELYTSETAYLKKSVVIVPVTVNGRKYYKLIFYSNWLKIPGYKEVDSMHLSWDDGAFYDNADSVARSSTFAKMRYTYTTTKKKRMTGEILSNYTSTYTQNFFTSDEYYLIESGSRVIDLPVGNYSLSNHSMIVLFDIPDWDSVIDEYYNTITERALNNIVITMSLYVKPNTFYNGFWFDAIYNHTKHMWGYDIKKINITSVVSSNIKVTITKLILENAKAVSFNTYTTSCGGNLYKMYRYK